MKPRFLKRSFLLFLHILSITLDFFLSFLYKPEKISWILPRDPVCNDILLSEQSVHLINQPQIRSAQVTRYKNQRKIHKLSFHAYASCIKRYTNARANDKNSIWMYSTIIQHVLVRLNKQFKSTNVKISTTPIRLYLLRIGRCGFERFEFSRLAANERVPSTPLRWQPGHSSIEIDKRKAEAITRRKLTTRLES